MAIKSIEDIRRIRDEIREQIKLIDLNIYKDQTFGSENEYTYKGLIGGVEALLADLTVLVKSENRFIKFTTYSERSSIISYLSNIKAYLNVPGNLYPQVDQLKTILRPFNLKYFQDHFIEFEKEIEEARKIKLIIQQDRLETSKEIEDIKSSSTSILKIQESSNEKLSELENEIEQLTTKKDNLELEIESLETKNDEVEKLKNTALDHSETIKVKLDEVTSSEKLIKNFALNIQKSEANIVLLDSRLEESEKKLSAYEEERNNILKEANSLIESARQALKYTTAKGISESFQTKHDNSTGFLKLGVWLVGAGVFMILILALSFWILFEPTYVANVVIGRILMVPVLALGLYFCISQYNKQKNIIEDYAYKTVVATAIVGFSEQIKKHESDNTDEYVTYMKTALAEIHQDPLRKRGKVEDSNMIPENIDANKMLELFKKFLEVSKAAS